MPHLFRLALASAIAVASLAGCANKAITKSSTVTSSESTSSTALANSKLPNRTGIKSCDAYLSSYLACHRAADIFSPNQLQGHYQAMRISLLHDSMDPDTRPLLAARCNALSSQLRGVLGDKLCDTAVAPASTPH